tara:strand:- start:3827 stop:4084 length:258 start_codon:yes stop_codon:yes gene_type:complete
MVEEQPKAGEITLTANGRTYRLDDLSDEVKELVGLHAQANDMMLQARRQAVIHEVSTKELARIIEQKLEEADSDADGLDQQSAAG